MISKCISVAMSLNHLKHMDMSRWVMRHSRWLRTSRGNHLEVLGVLGVVQKCARASVGGTDRYLKAM
jgi:hypothetical protein